MARRIVGTTAGALAVVVLGLTGCASKTYDVTENLPYDTTIGVDGTFDLYEPTSDSGRANRPAILAIHGGAWRGGDKAWGEQFAEELCPFGYVVFSVNYRVSTRPNGKWPAQIEDVQSALRYIRANAARFRIDPDRVASLGMSAGGHLATMVALRDDPAGSQGRVTTAVNLDGEHDMTMPPDRVMADFDAILTSVMGHGPPWSDAELRDISTVTFVRPDVSVLTVHGAGDDNVFVAQGERITAALRAKGAEAELVRLEGDEGDCHEDCWKVPVARRAIHRFLDRRLSHDGDRFFEDRYGTRSPRMDDLVEIGVFAPSGGAGPAERRYLTRHRITSGEQTIRVTMPKESARAGIDPHRKLIDRDRGDNVVDVKAQAR